MTASSPAFAAITQDDHRGLLWIAAILSFIFVILTLSARLYVRKHMLGRDDYASIVAVVLGIAQYTAVFAGMPLGLGTSKELDRHGNHTHSGQVFLVSEGLFICSLYAAKCAVLLAVERLLAADMETTRNFCILLRVAIGVAALASLLAFSVGCSLGNLLVQDQRRCGGQTLRWIAVTVLDGITEFCILGMFCSIIWTLQMRVKLKMTLTTLLGMRLVSPVLTAIYTWALSSFVLSSDPAVHVISPLVWQQITLGYSLMSALLIALMPFLKSFHTGMGVDMRNLTNIGTSASRQRSGRQDAYRLDNLTSRSRHGTSTTKQSAEDEEELASARWASALPKQASSESQIEARSSVTAMAGAMVIQKTVDWSVKYDSNSNK
ncbi:hypothetical protein NOR_07377 [Metarhizium rileyi]|uniref:Rhodopsin domain-containing protein n=1 Tax=Metarhizium rileyi (strain RCEF 4871) TaxID=1649241 RepID=A0A166YFQ6_METRR|nr:hypothetical protein NOR_07377 [Metarhizium rileyi RCEF 4871]